jgi:uncharacterized LabA/DUF88 family protein
MTTNQKPEEQITTAAVWFIDGYSLYKAAKKDGQFIQYKKLRLLLENEFKIPLREVFYFDSAAHNDGARKRHDYLKGQLGFRVETFEPGRKTTKCPHCDEEFQAPIQKCVDIALAQTIWEYATKTSPVSYNPILLSTGDRDFQPVLKKVRDSFDKEIVLVAPKKATAPELVSLTTKQIWIENHYSSVADLWSDRHSTTPPANGLGTQQVDDTTQLDRAQNDAANLMRRVWEGLKRDEKSFSTGHVGRPWGYILFNFGKECAVQSKTEQHQTFLVQSNGRWKGASARCLELAKQIWHDASILNDENGHAYLVRPA